MANQYQARESDYHKTLFQLRELGLGVRYKCAQCSSESDLNIEELIQEHGGETRLRFVQRSSKCRWCYPS